jgi:Dehydrogenases (flavoproteins)
MLEGDLDVQGAMGLSDEVRNGFQQIRMTIRIARRRARGEAAPGRPARHRPLRGVRQHHLGGARHRPGRDRLTRARRRPGATRPATGTSPRSTRWTPQYDAIVVGGRCAGAATAMLLARGGLHVLVLEAARPGTDTLSTHALMRGGVLQLSRWGLLDAVVAADTAAIRHTEFGYGERPRPSTSAPRTGSPRSTHRDGPSSTRCCSAARARA